jgi:hypothetical protein
MMRVTAGAPLGAGCVTGGRNRACSSAFCASNANAPPRHGGCFGDRSWSFSHSSVWASVSSRR